MKTVYKLILKSYAGPMFLSLAIVMFVLLLQFMWRWIDELVGRGLTFDIILELMFYASASLIPTGLPLATLFAAIMTMGDLGENNELLALKCAGMSLPRILRPLIIFVFFVAIGSFFVANNLVPYSMRKMSALIADIRSQKQTLEFRDGIFYNGIDNLSIRVDRQNSRTGLLEDVLIYDTRKNNGDMMTTMADSGYIKLSDDKNFLLVTLYNGRAYEETRNNTDWLLQNELRQHEFERQDMVIDLKGFNMERRDDSQFAGSSKSKNIRQLTADNDSLSMAVGKLVDQLNSQFLGNGIFVYNKEMSTDTVENIPKYMVDVTDSIASLDEIGKGEIMANALRMANNAKSYINFDESYAKTTLNQLYRSQIEWHRMLSLPVSVMIFFLIGAPFGAIIRKGGLGLPVVVSVVFFIIYYIISLSGEKMAGEGNWSAFRGMWISTFVLFPIAIFLIYKATNDSNLFNMDSYRAFFRRLREFFHRLFKTKTWVNHH